MIMELLQQPQQQRATVHWHSTCAGAGTQPMCQHLGDIRCALLAGTHGRPAGSALQLRLDPHTSMD
jgi:hypothetical protein